MTSLRTRSLLTAWLLIWQLCVPFHALGHYLESDGGHAAPHSHGDGVHGHDHDHVHDHTHAPHASEPAAADDSFCEYCLTAAGAALALVGAPATTFAPAAAGISLRPFDIDSPAPRRAEPGSARGPPSDLLLNSM